MNENRTCGECGTELPANAPEGLCPRCLANMGLGLLRTAALPESDFLVERAGTMIGRYRLLERIGEGGFGVVYMAEQQEPVQRRVALKVIKAGMDTREVIARFEAERQALALMDHPNIARVLDGGATAAGRPYFVMELVRGIPITDYCDQDNLTTRERLQLFVKVCQAVQHAHQKGVIHRDLKPSNVLVTLHDGEPVPKVIDFGVAKALGQKLTQKTLFTGFQQMIGTPAYMSPEQAALSGLDIDTRADIYSLGVLLYELLTGVTPFDGATFREAALDEIRRLIRETEPPKPSTKLDTLGDKLTEVAKHRRTEPAALSRLVRGDLDWIVMRCLEKDRTRRYETANGLAKDIERHLTNEPVVARPPSRLYLFQKLVRRNKLACAAIGAVSLSLLLGLTLSTWLFLRERTARQRAEAAEQTQSRLRREADSARLQADAEKEKAAAETAKNLAVSLNESAARMRKFGHLPEAEKVLREALVLQEAVLGSEDPIVATTLNNLATALERQGKLAEAESVLRESLATERSRVGDDHLAVLNRTGSLVDFLMRQGRYHDADQLFNDILTPTLVNQPQNFGLLSWRAEFFGRRGRWKEALSDAARALELQPTNHIYCHRLAPLLVANGDVEGYRRLCRQMLVTFRRANDPVINDIVAKDCLILPPPGPELNDIAEFAEKAVTIGASHSGLPWFQVCKGLAEYRQGRPASAADWARKTLAQSGRTLERDVLAYAVVAMAEHKSGRADAARAALTIGFEIADTKLPKPEGGNLGNLWVDCIIARTLIGEAKTLVEAGTE